LKVKAEIWNGMRSPFWAKHIKDSMFIENLSRWCQSNAPQLHVCNQR
jgi:hypothetical protein